MSRNASGTYTLPVSAFSAGAVIKSADMNSNLSDIATALTQSLATTGVSSMTGPILAASGTVAAPGITFVSDTDTGFYRIADGTVGVSSNGTNIVTVSASGVAVTGTFSVSGAATLSTTLHLVGAATLDSTLTVASTITSTGTLTASNNFTVTAGTVTINTTTTWVFGSASAKTAFWTGIGSNFTLQYTIEGGGSVPTTGSKGFIEVPSNCTITRWTIMADQSGSAVVDVNKSTYAGFPPVSSIAGSEKPTLSAVQKNQDTNLTTWTTAFTAGDILGFDLDSVTTCTRIQVSLFCTKTGS